MKLFNRPDELNGGNIKYVCESCGSVFYTDDKNNTCPKCGSSNYETGISRELYIFSDCFSYHNGKPDQMAGFCTIITNDRFELEDNKNIECVIRKAFNGKTNNYGELLGVLMGLEYLLNNDNPCFYDNVTVISDSEYVILGCRERMYRWKNKGWKNTSGSVKNLELWKKVYDDILSLRNMGINLTFKHQKGHLGKTVSKEENNLIYLQEKCDSLAVDLKEKIIKRSEVTNE